MEDYENFTRLAHYFNAIQVLGNQVAAPLELAANNRHLDTYRANLTLSDLCFHCSAIGRGRALDGIEMMAISRGISLEAIAQSPGVITVINVNSPRRFDEEMANGLMAMSRHGQAVSVTPFTLMGAMTPVTLAAGLTQQNAEALFGLALTQLTKPGAPVVYGSFTSNVDMRSGAPAFGTPEHAKANVASGLLARRYNLPYRSSNSSASNVVDAQAAYETQMSLWGSVLGGTNLLYHAAGWMEGGLQSSYEKFIIDVEMLQQMMEFLTPIDLSEEALAFEAMERVPTGGHFFGDEHTLERTSMRSTRRSSAIGRTTARGRMPGRRQRRSGRPRSGRLHWATTSNPRWMMPSARNWTSTWPTARNRSDPETHEGPVRTPGESLWMRDLRDE